MLSASPSAASTSLSGLLCGEHAAEREPLLSERDREHITHVDHAPMVHAGRRRCTVESTWVDPSRCARTPHTDLLTPS
jgi:hypothetical protein